MSFLASSIRFTPIPFLAFSPPCFFRPRRLRCLSPPVLPSPQDLLPTNLLFPKWKRATLSTLFARGTGVCFPCACLGPCRISFSIPPPKSQFVNDYVHFPADTSTSLRFFRWVVVFFFFGLLKTMFPRPPLPSLANPPFRNIIPPSFFNPLFSQILRRYLNDYGNWISHPRPISLVLPLCLSPPPRSMFPPLFSWPEVPPCHPFAPTTRRSLWKIQLWLRIVSDLPVFPSAPLWLNPTPFSGTSHGIASHP